MQTAIQDNSWAEMELTECLHVHLLLACSQRQTSWIQPIEKGSACTFHSIHQSVNLFIMIYILEIASNNMIASRCKYKSFAH
jgi:hypothetical protein